MLTDVHRLTHVVNTDDACIVDCCLHEVHDGLVTELWERLEWTLRNRLDGNAAEWARRAGLKSRSHILVTIRRRGTMSAPTVAKLARAAGVSVLWLVDGTGGPDAATQTSSDDDYAARRIAVAAARKKALATPGAIAAAQSLSGEEFRLWKSRRWGALIDGLSLAELRGNTAAFQALLREARERAAVTDSADDEADDPAPVRATAGGT